MKPILLLLITAALLTGCASNRLVSYDDCPVTPTKMRADYLRGYGDGARQMDKANNAGRY